MSKIGAILLGLIVALVGFSVAMAATGGTPTVATQTFTNVVTYTISTVTETVTQTITTTAPTPPPPPPPPPSVVEVPFAGGASAANIAINTAGERSAQRFVARRTGTLTKLHVRVKSSGSGYAAGNTGRWTVSFHRTLASGLPDTSATLSTENFVPLSRDVGGQIELSAGFAVTKGQEFWLIVRNSDSSPTVNWASTNFLFTGFDLAMEGANGRNERNAGATDVFYGLDPRETTAWSTDGGTTWAVPGGPYGANSGKSFLPTYIQEYSDGVRVGQPYYYSLAAPDGISRMFYPGFRGTSINGIQTWNSTSGSVRCVLYVNGVVRADVTLTGRGARRASFAAVAVPVGAQVRIDATQTGGVLRKLYADANWAGKMGLGTSYKWYLEGDPVRSVPVYPLPWLPTESG